MSRLRQLYDNGDVLAAADYALDDLLYMVDVSEPDPDLQSKATTYGDLLSAIFGGAFPSDAVFNSITGPGGFLRFGADAVGVDVAALDFTATVGRSTGAADPSAFSFRVGVRGASSAVLQTATEGFRLEQKTISTGDKIVGMFPNGPLWANVPVNVHDAFLQFDVGAVVGHRFRTVRAGGSANFTLSRSEGTYAAPTQVPTGTTVGGIFGEGLDNALALQTVGSISFVTRENVTSTAAGGTIRFAAPETGVLTLRTLMDLRAGNSTTTEMVAGLASFCLIPGATAFVIRDSANTFDAHTFVANGLTASLAQGATTSQVHVGTGTGSGDTLLSIRGAAGTLRGIQFQTGGNARWIWRVDNVAESGADAGSSLRLLARTDAGGAIDDPIIIVRAAQGQMTLARPILHSANATTGNFLRISGSLTATGGGVRSQRIDNTLIAAANNDILYGIDLALTITPGAFTGLTKAAIRIAGNSTAMTGNKYGVIIGPMSAASGENMALRVEGNARFIEPVTVNGTITTSIAHFQIGGTITASAAASRAQYITSTMVAAANNDGLFALDITPNFTPGAFTGTIAHGIRIANITGAATNFAFLTGSGQHQLGGETRVRTTVTPQFSVQYDASNRMDVTLTSAGAVTFDAVGGSAGFAFSDGVAITGQSSVTFSNASAISLNVVNNSGGEQVAFSGFNFAGVRFFASNAGSNAKNWRLNATGSGTMVLTLVNDGISATTDVVTITRSTSASISTVWTGDFQSDNLRAPSSNLPVGVDASGTDIAAASFTFQGPRSTGNATPATIRFQTTIPAASGASLQTRRESFRISAVTTATNTDIMVYDVDNATLERVTVGAADSGGAGFKVLRIPN